MTVFADSSALVKLYADEPGDDAVRALPGPMLVSALARVEVPSALWRKHRMGELSLGDTNLLARAFEVDWAGSFGGGDEPAFVVIGATASVINQAARLVERHSLRAYDAVQLSSAVAAEKALQSPVTFVAFDHALLEAAALEHLDLLDR